MPSASLNYTITLRDNGPDGDGISVFAPFLVTLPSNATFESVTYGGTMVSSCTAPALAESSGEIACTGIISPGQFLSIDLTVRARPGLPVGTAITCTAAVPGQIDPDLSNNSATAVAFVGGPAPVPTLSVRGMLALGLLLALTAVVVLRR
jgi:Domain of unknown function DUF11